MDAYAATASSTSPIVNTPVFGCRRRCGIKQESNRAESSIAVNLARNPNETDPSHRNGKNRNDHDAALGRPQQGGPGTSGRPLQPGSRTDKSLQTVPVVPASRPERPRLQETTP